MTIEHNNIDKSIRYWAVSVLFSTVMFSWSFAILYRHYNFTRPDHTKESVMIADRVQENTFLEHNAKLRNVDINSLYFIPTGILIKSLSIQNENTIALSGSIWQTYSNENEHLKKDVLILNARNTQIAPTYTRKTKRGTVYGFDFKTELIEQFNYKRFPLDRQQITLELAHSSLTDPIILTPDFASWKLEGQHKIGIDPDLKPSGLIIERSFFSYTTENSVTTKGIDDYVFSDDFPILNFNMDVKRQVINLLILVFLPVITILVLSFAFLLMFRRLFSRPHSYITINAAILFALIVSHQRLRDLIPSNVPSYPEYAYFLSYLIILFNIMLAVRYVKTLGSTETIKSMPRETFFFRMIYWPFVSTMFFMITAIFFSS